ncbi:uncharacterized protein LOC763406 [Strongylocentrotus purpuratus]|uniref:Uncharacterized protein n=1 Tax=Strongylocentrotus purpuratus TaxID=7668 RepID=A0A7M7T1E4_STRPU|nr:uncharacterized protein LOC763406 [Strongylocentrotus purpuratus]
MTMVHSRSAIIGSKTNRLGPNTDRATTGDGHNRATSVVNQGTVSLIDKSKFQSGQDLLVTRSDSYLIRPRERPEDIWKRPPPDFTLQRYMPKPPKRNTRESMQPWRWGTLPGEKKIAQTIAEKPTVTLPKILQPPRPKSRKILTRFKIPDSDEARKVAVKQLVHHKEKFENPQPHDFRQYPPLGPLGLPEFVTSEERDPYNIKFKTENVDIVYGLPPQLSDRFNGDQMGRDVLKQPPKYEQHLLHPTGKWPSPSGEFSRYRARNRSPTTVLMDNVEETLTKKWALEKQERLRRNKEREEAEKKLIFEQKVAREVAHVTKKTKDLETRDDEFGAWHDHLHMKNSRGYDHGSSYSTISSDMTSDL